MAGYTTTPVFPMKQEHLVILTSTDAIVPPEWGRYLEQDWDRLVRQDSRILVACGVHGGDDGRVGDPDYGLVRDNQSQVKYLERKYKEDIDKKNIRIDIVDVGAYFDKTKLDEQKFVKAIQNYKPTMMILGFCYTHVSDMNTILRAGGVYAIMVLKRDRHYITEGRYIVLDQVQEEVVRGVVENNYKNVFLWGSGGSGKTIVAAQILGKQSILYLSMTLQLDISLI